MTDDELRDLYFRYGPVVYRKALTLLRDSDEAQDALQEVFVRALRHARSQGELHVGWLCRVTVTLCLNRIRDAKLHRSLNQQATEGQQPLRSMHPLDAATLQVVLAAAEPRSAEAAVYVHMEGMSHDEAADVMGVSRRTIGNLLERFHAHAAKHLGDDERFVRKGLS